MGALSKLMAGWAGKLLFAALAVAVPLLGVWIGSSIAALQNGPIWLVLLAGLAAFPLAPVGWDLLATWRRRRTKGAGPRILTAFDRIVLRTLVLNLALVGGLVATRPAIVFEALSARGDWMLEREHAPWADSARSFLHTAADRLEWLHTALHPNPYEALVSDDGKDVQVEIARDDTLQQLREALRRGASPVGTTTIPDPTPKTPVDPYGDDAWPFRPQLHPAVVAIPAEAEASIESVARYLVDAEPDRTKRIKALHDYVADRVAYDVPAYRAGEFGAQDAQSVFATHKSVCAGYANLLAALGDAAGEEIVVVTGDARGLDGELSGEGHAWNAAKLDHGWVLLDATWNAGSVGDVFHKDYETTFLMSPAEVFGVTHFPDDAKWQLREAPISRGDFLRQPSLHGEFFAHGMKLVTPDRSQTTVSDSLSITVDNPGGYALRVGYQHRDDDGPVTNHCRREAHDYLCRFGSPGDYRVAFFGPPGFLGAIQVNVRG